jgi:hypothetical protein
MVIAEGVVESRDTIRSDHNINGVEEVFTRGTWPLDPFIVVEQTD